MLLLPRVLSEIINYLAGIFITPLMGVYLLNRIKKRGKKFNKIFYIFLTLFGNTLNYLFLSIFAAPEITWTHQFTMKYVSLSIFTMTTTTIILYVVHEKFDFKLKIKKKDTDNE